MQGVITALATPFKNDTSLSLDLHSLQNIIKLQLEAGIAGLVVAGTTGEHFSLSEQEYSTAISTCTAAVKGSIPIIAGVHANNPLDAIRKSKIAEEAGANILMISQPYYNKPPQEGIFQYFETIHKNTTANIIVYDAAERCAVSIQNNTMIDICNKLERIVAIKDASGNIELPAFYTQNIASDKISLLCGNDTMILPFMAQGGRGCISVLSNISPEPLVKMVELFRNNNAHEAIKINQSLYNLNQSLQIATNPIAIKYALYKLGMCESAAVRMPLSSLHTNARLTLDKLLDQYHIPVKQIHV